MGGADIDEREDLMNYSIQLSKDFKALKVWMTIEVYGHSVISKAIRNDIEMALYAYEKIKIMIYSRRYTSLNCQFFVSSI